MKGGGQRQDAVFYKKLREAIWGELGSTQARGGLEGKLENGRGRITFNLREKENQWPGVPTRGKKACRCVLWGPGETDHD